MVKLHLDVVISEDRQLLVKLPGHVPVGRAKVIVELETQEGTGVQSIRDVLVAGGAVVMDFGEPEADEALILSESELVEFGQLMPDAPSVLTLIDEDRGTR